MTEISILKIEDDTTVDGPGFRTSIYCAGCSNHCPGCHNPQSWNISNGVFTHIDVIFERIKANRFSNVTFTGGDPMCQPLAFARLARRIKAETDKTIWCYTGYTYEECLASPDKKELLEHVDVLVDGRFILSQKDESLLFKGSRNQRLVDVPKSLLTGRVQIFEYNPFPEFDDLSLVKPVRLVVEGATV